MEILAPVGSPQALVAAIKGNADAVYLGGKRFGARKFSDNFDNGQLEGAVNYAHDNGVKVYVTVNTLIKNSEMADAISFVKYLKDIGADAVIVQDIGFLRTIGRIDIPKHASTQMGIHSRKGLQWCHDNGLDRVILSRELTLDEMEHVIEDTPIEVEVFTQGALCYCISGGCLFSSIVGGRSGNRGECAQPCRKRYTSKMREGYLMNTADLYCIEHFGRLRKMGVAAVKIEGRMRSPAHTYLTSKVYSLIKNNEKGAELERMKHLLMTIFNRGYGTGYMDGVHAVVQPMYPDNRGQFIASVHISGKKFDTDGIDINVKDGLSIFKGEEKIGGLKVSSAGSRLTVPFSIPDGHYEIYRTYDPRIDEIKNIFSEVPRFIGTKTIGESRFEPKVVVRGKKETELSFYVSSVKVLNAVKGYADRVYFESNDETDDAKAICDPDNIEFVTILPRFSPVDEITDGNVMVHNPGQMSAGTGRHYGSYHMNMFNSMFPNVLHQVTLSAELSKKQIKEICDRYQGRLEQMVFGRLELMATRDPEMTSCTLVDEKGFEFPVYKDDRGLSHILNSADLLLLDRLDELSAMGIDSFGIDLRKRPVGVASKVAKVFRDRDVGKKDKIIELCGNVTQGHYMRGV